MNEQASALPSVCLCESTTGRARPIHDLLASGVDRRPRRAVARAHAGRDEAARAAGKRLCRSVAVALTRPPRLRLAGSGRAGAACAAVAIERLRHGSSPANASSGPSGRYAAMSCRRRSISRSAAASRRRPSSVRSRPIRRRSPASWWRSTSLRRDEPVDHAGDARPADGELLGEHRRGLLAVGEEAQRAVLRQRQVDGGGRRLDLPRQARDDPPRIQG